MASYERPRPHTGGRVMWLAVGSACLIVIAIAATIMAGLARLAAFLIWGHF